MDPPVIAALITAVASLIVAIWTKFHLVSLERERHSLNEAGKASDRRVTAEQELRRYREPLLDAANDLGHRINNIRHDQFLSYLDDADRRRLALDSTFYRLARYFGALEVLYANVNHLRFEQADQTRSVADQIAVIGRTFADDKYDRTGHDFRSSRLILWREEQRAIGEAVRPRDGTANLYVGFSEFVARLNETDGRWFERFGADLQQPAAEHGDRLVELHRALACLVELLDAEDGRFVRSDGTYAARWLEPAALAPPTSGSQRFARSARQRAPR